ncbi:PLP-dependent aminotransferase family protein [Clostridium scatologenes]|uniref:Transcriptional regulator, GntR family with aminotransferase domain n=1 Tax=Clostridium scatologenes TaxID=1548 RepID=A0A0E3MAC0_CLOSL|nr:PLP-dependent aminotransferase family protein [Clostridium scatologenes]AKA71938.1 transcriptional regulator, GntR family with aminotransferase domain [Clostridium scatologenes]
MDKYFVSMQGEIPKYITITKHIKRLIDINKIEDGEKLPSIRSLSEFLNVNNVTIVNAYKRLQNEGYAVQKMGSGTYAKKKDITKNFKKEYSEALKKISGKMVKEYVDFTGETPSNDFFPVQSFKDVLNEVLDRDGAEALIYQEALGYEGLRKSISEVFWNKKIKSDDILIVSGAQQGIDIVSKALINTNDNVIVEKPTYSGALSVFKWRRANIYEVPIGKDGIDVDKFEKILKKNNIKCFYTMSYFQNPTGMSYSIEKKQQILNLAEIYDFYIIEDDYLAELIYDHSIKYKSFKSLDKNDRVIYIKSFSKIFLPGIRIGYLIPPMKFKESIENSKINTDISTSSLMQRALDLYIKKGLWKDYMNNLNHIYKNRYLLMEDCIKSHLENKVDFISPGGGLNFYLRIKDSIYVDSIELFRKTKDRKVLITPGTLFYKSPSEGKKYFRISFSQTDEEAMKKGLSIINELLE